MNAEADDAGQGILRDVVRRSIANPLPFGWYGRSGQQMGYCAGGDPAAYVYLGDVNVETAHRARGMRKFRVSFGEQAPTDLWPPR